MEFPLLAELLSHLCKGCAGFIGTGTGEQAIVEVFLQVSMLLEIDEHGGFLASVIHNELNTFHLLAILPATRAALRARPYASSLGAQASRLLQKRPR